MDEAEQGADRGFHLLGVVACFSNQVARAAGHPEKRLLWTLLDLRSENIRAYISRSFTNHMWKDIFGNKHMQKVGPDFVGPGSSARGWTVAGHCLGADLPLCGAAIECLLLPTLP